jgi:4-amino-4-deoxy-L-arabinose transferase-like glycosyltransferase
MLRSPSRMKFHFENRIPCLCSPITFLLVGILVLGAVSRFSTITQPFTDALNWREACNAMMASNFYHGSWNIFYPEVNWSGPSPGYSGFEFQTVSYIAALLYVIMGEHEWVGRSVAALFGLWGIYALYQLVRRVWDEERALLSAAVMAVLPGSIFIERSFLSDPAMVALMTTSIWILIVYLETDRLRFLLLSAVIGTWGVLTKPPGVVVSFAMVYATLTILRFRHKLKPSRIAVISIVGTLALVPVIAYYLWARHLGHSYPPYHVSFSGYLLWDQGLKQWLDENYFLGRLVWWFVTWLWTPPVIVLVALGIIFPFRAVDSEKHTSATAPWLFHWWLLGMVPLYIVAARELVLNPQNFHIINPAAAALSSDAIMTIASFIAKVARSSSRVVVRTRVIAASLIIIAVSGTMALIRMCYPYAKQGYELGLALRQVSQPRDLVVTMANVLGDPIVIYYSQRRGWLFPPPPTVDVTELPEDDRESIQTFEKLRARGAAWLGIVAPQQAKLKRDHPVLLAHFQRTCCLYQRNPKWFIYSIIPSAPGN